MSRTARRGGRPLGGAADAAAPGRTAYAQALEETVATVRRRLARFRLLSVLVPGAAMLSVVWAAAARSWWPAAILGSALPLYMTWLWVDQRAVRLWSGRILDLWCEGKLDLDLFRETASGLPSIPEGTLRGMLGVLPAVGASPAAAGPLPAAMRRAVALTTSSLRAYEADLRWVDTYVRIGFVLLLALAVVRRSWIPLAGIPLVVLTASLVRGARGALHFGRWKRQVLAVEGVDPDLLRHAATWLEGGGVRRSVLDAWVARLNGA